MRRAARETPGEVVTMSARTDLALEAKELREAAEQPLPAGVRCTERREKGVRINCLLYTSRGV